MNKHMKMFGGPRTSYLCIKTWLIEKRDGHTIMFRVCINHPMCSWCVAIVGQHTEHVANIAHKCTGYWVGGDPLVGSIFDLKCSHVGFLVDQGQQAILCTWGSTRKVHIDVMCLQRQHANVAVGTTCTHAKDSVRTTCRYPLQVSSLHKSPTGQQRTSVCSPQLSCTERSTSAPCNACAARSSIAPVMVAT